MTALENSATVEGTFVARRNRFAADVLVNGREAVAHVANSGRMTELLVQGAPVLLRRAPAGSDRRTAYDLLLIRHVGRWVGLDARMPPRAVIDAWRDGLLPSFAAYDLVTAEVRYGASRIDLLFEGPPGKLYVEAKSCNLVVDGTALFPDAPTVRGAKHMAELASAVRQGHRAAAVFVVQRDDALRLMPFAEADPVFADALRGAAAGGVEAHAVVCEAGPAGLRPLRTVPVVLEGAMV
jgi:sugar fermentation stimulation protein A